MDAAQRANSVVIIEQSPEKRRGDQQTSPMISGLHEAMGANPLNDPDDELDMRAEGGGGDSDIDSSYQNQPE
jgi:hypothetical protein